MTQTPSWDEKGRRLYVKRDGTKCLRDWDHIRSGDVPISDLDDDEVAQGMLKRTREMRIPTAGTGPKLVPAELADARTRLLVERVTEQFKGVAFRATQVFIDVMENPEASDADKMKAATYLHQRLLGKVPDRVEITAEIKPWENLVGGILRESDGGNGPSTPKAE